MNIIEFQSLKNVIQTSDIIQLSELSDKSDRTLLYGYTCSRYTWHLYLKTDVIHKVIYGHSDEFISHTAFETGISVYDASPDKRLYPECCDYDFCKLMMLHGGDLPFTSWSDREQQQYYGLTLEEINNDF